MRRGLAGAVLAACLAAVPLTLVAIPQPAFGSACVTTSNCISINGVLRQLDGTNVWRFENQLIKYDRSNGQTVSPANEWGYEVSVVNGKVTAISDSLPGMTIPVGGYVLSGHGTEDTWLRANAPVGATVVLPGETAPAPTPTPSPPPPPPSSLAATGQWSVTSTSMPLRAMHATALRNGKVLLLAGSGNNYNDFSAGTFKAAVYDPVAQTFVNIRTPQDMFCSGQVTLPDGRVLIQGGTASYAGTPVGEAFRGLRTSYVFDPATNVFTKTPNLTIEGHWYPTLTRIENGNVWAAGGYTHKTGGGGSTSTEMYNSGTGSWMTAAQVPQTNRFMGLYPHMFLLADKRMFYTGGHTFGEPQPGTGSFIYNWRNATMGDVPGLRDAGLRDQAGSVLLPPAQNQTFMIAGGGSTDNGGATNSVDLIDMKVASPRWTPGPAVPGVGRMYLNLTNLPDRTVLASNGATGNRTGNVSAASIYNPATNTWASVPPDPIGRNYHSATLVLPGGRVMVFGSNPSNGSYELRISQYEPPYLFKGTRPTVTNPGNVTYGQTVSLGVTGNVVSASLLSPMSSTHQTDTNSRLVDLPITGTGATRTATFPSNPALLTPGPYMLTVLDDNGSVSPARWVYVQ